MTKTKTDKRKRIIFEAGEVAELLDKVEKKMTVPPYGSFNKSNLIRKAVEKECRRILGDDA